MCGPQSAAMSSPRAVASPPLLLLALLGAAAALEVAVSYRGFRLLRVSVADVEHSAAVAALVDAGKLSLWAERRRDTADVLAAPAHWDAVQRLFQAVALNYTVLTHDLQVLSVHFFDPLALKRLITHTPIQKQARRIK